MPTRKCCFVPVCKNTVTNSPDKIFISLSKDVDVRKKWFAAVNRDINLVSLASTFFCCEDHFNLQEDMANYYEYKYSKVKIRMKTNVVPHIFNSPIETTGRANTRRLGNPPAPRIRKAKKRKVDEILAHTNPSQEIIPSTSNRRPASLEDKNNVDWVPSLLMDAESNLRENKKLKLIEEHNHETLNRQCIKMEANTHTVKEEMEDADDELKFDNSFVEEDLPEFVTKEEIIVKEEQLYEDADQEETEENCILPQEQDPLHSDAIRILQPPQSTKKKTKELLLRCTERCTVCLSDAGHYNIFNTERDGITICTMLELCTSLKIQQQFEFSPQLICFECFDELEVCNKFRKKYTEAQSILDQEAAAQVTTTTTTDSDASEAIMNDSDNSDTDNNIDADSEETSSAKAYAPIPEKSRARYETTYRVFKDWCQAKKFDDINEKVLLAYFIERNAKLKAASSLWAEYSMLRSTIFLHDAVRISKFSSLLAFLKRKNMGYRSKKASVFTREHIREFLIEAPDDNYLIHKVAMILGISGACRREELYKMTIQDIEDCGDLLMVKIPTAKPIMQRTFTVCNPDNDKIQYLELIRKYIQLRPSRPTSDRLFLNMRNGLCTNQVVGKGTIGSWPSKIAAFLELPNPANYNAHSFRRTSATMISYFNNINIV